MTKGIHSLNLQIFLNQVILKESQGRLYWSVFTATHAGVCGFFLFTISVKMLTD